MANLHAFARLYGVVRWFHPSDAAAVIDWDRFAVDGVRRILDAPDPQARRAVLTALIAPFAPTVHITGPGEPFPDDPALHPGSTTGLEVVAWEHEGFGDSLYVSEYASKRRHRPRIAPVPGLPLVMLWQSVDATPYRGMRIRLRGKLRTAGQARGQLWLRVDRGDAIGFSDEMNNHPVISATWTPGEIVGSVDADATRIAFGPIMNGGAGIAWYDDVELAVAPAGGAWRPVEIKDPGFEAGEPTAAWAAGDGRRRLASFDGWTVALDHDQPGSGATALRIERATRATTDELFADAPGPGETVDIDLGSGLRARIPIALYSNAGHTIGDDPEAARRSQPAIPPPSAARFDPIAGIADVIVLWNAIQHFWPYWDVVSTDWNAELDIALRDELEDRSIDAHVATLRRLTVAAPDAHASTSCPGESRRAYPRFRVELIENQIVVTASDDPAVTRGDIIVSVDGHSASEELAAAESLISGSPQSRRVRAYGNFGAGPVGSTLQLRLRRQGADLEARIARGDPLPAQPTHPSIERFDDGVYYVDLERVSMADIDAVMDKLAAAPGVVFDVREYPNGNDQLLSHLLTRPDDSDAWLAVARVIRPDHRPTSIAGWKAQGWNKPVLQPHISGRVAFLTGPRAASYAESVMSFVEHYHLGEIVGSATAGTNGNVIQVGEPTGCRTRLTGLRVTKHDGSQHHLIGILPTIPATRTLAGVAARRDEVLDKALAYVRTGVK